MNSTNGLTNKFLTGCFLQQTKERLKTATTEKEKEFLNKHIQGLKFQLQSIYN